ncbi:alpha/beta fold hydrolase [Nonomuraea candida]|uniref:alpha/beta fold hydrolase n=1 Tax=Nonomuraea candida TaxID=359159 RepID=UPI0005BA3302|nr:alpha/beta hydrolase [Nonomuraea candida]
MSRLVLVAPAFLQAPSPRFLRSRPAALLLRRLPASRLARALAVPEGPAIAGAATDLSRPGAASRVVAALRAVATGRRELREALGRLQVPVEIVTGSADPLTVPVDRPVTTIDGAGHYPQLTHPEQLARTIIGARLPARP